ncbi:plasmid replication protein RepC [Cognatishimia sp. MH4019]|uniref:plasmid replication protein RepC n=1 Tax=Cognatishimia sp. MH4019 TaxID=2854030 RepID=UPI001CD1CFDC|nr:plasmid replication protein RepC [Cognatishimia sp. MH4019]
MQRLTTTPFGRTLSAAVLETIDRVEAGGPVPHIDKWEVFRQLCTARQAFGVTDRDLTVLNALLSFHPGKILGDNAPLIVFPSNKALSERAHGMAESTLRRHLASLVAAGLLLRHDSPNGKRYARRGAGGELVRAFGFDLKPLLVRADEIAHAAQAAEDAAERMRMRREEVSLLRRDALNLVLYGQEAGLSGDWEKLLNSLMETHKALRRRLDAGTLDALHNEMSELLDLAQAMLTDAEKMSGNARRYERPIQNSNTDDSDLEPSLEKERSGGPSTNPEMVHDQKEPRIPLGLVLKACPDIEPYSPHEIRHWHELVAVACLVRGMMGISPSAWAEAQRAMGPENAAAVLAGMLQKVEDIRSPGGYLRRLTQKAEDGAFSPGPMIMALLRGGES